MFNGTTLVLFSYCVGGIALSLCGTSSGYPIVSSPFERQNTTLLAYNFSSL